MTERPNENYDTAHGLPVTRQETPPLGTSFQRLRTAAGTAASTQGHQLSTTFSDRTGTRPVSPLQQSFADSAAPVSLGGFTIGTTRQLFAAPSSRLSSSSTAGLRVAIPQDDEKSDDQRGSIVRAPIAYFEDVLMDDASDGATSSSPSVGWEFELGGALWEEETVRVRVYDVEGFVEMYFENEGRDETKQENHKYEDVVRRYNVAARQAGEVEDISNDDVEEQITMGGMAIPSRNSAQFRRELAFHRRLHQAQVQFDVLQVAYQEYRDCEENYVTPAMAARLEWEQEYAEGERGGDATDEFDWPEGCALLVSKNNEALFVYRRVLQAEIGQYRPWGYTSFAVPDGDCVFQPMTKEAEANTTRALSFSVAALSYEGKVYKVMGGVAPVAYWIELFDLDCALEPSHYDIAAHGVTYRLRPRMLGGSPGDDKRNEEFMRRERPNAAKTKRGGVRRAENTRRRDATQGVVRLNPGGARPANPRRPGQASIRALQQAAGALAAAGSGVYDRVAAELRRHGAAVPPCPPPGGVYNPVKAVEAAQALEAHSFFLLSLAVGAEVKARANPIARASVVMREQAATRGVERQVGSSASFTLRESDFPELKAVVDARAPKIENGSAAKPAPTTSSAAKPASTTSSAAKSAAPTSRAEASAPATAAVAVQAVRDDREDCDEKQPAVVTVSYREERKEVAQKVVNPGFEKISAIEAARSSLVEAKLWPEQYAEHALSDLRDFDPELPPEPVPPPAPKAATRQLSQRSDDPAPRPRSALGVMTNAPSPPLTVAAPSRPLPIDGNKTVVRTAVPADSATVAPTKAPPAPDTPPVAEAAPVSAAPKPLPATAALPARVALDPAVAPDVVIECEEDRFHVIDVAEEVEERRPVVVGKQGVVAKLKKAARGLVERAQPTRAQKAVKLVAQSIARSRAEAAGTRDALREMGIELRRLRADQKRASGPVRTRLNKEIAQKQAAVDRLRRKLEADDAPLEVVDAARKGLAESMLNIADGGSGDGPEDEEVGQVEGDVERGAKDKDPPKRKAVVEVNEDEIVFNDGIVLAHQPTAHFFEGARISEDGSYIVWQDDLGLWTMCSKNTVTTAMLASGKLYTDHEYSAVGTRDWIINPMSVIAKLHELSDMSAEMAAVYMRGAAQAHEVRLSQQRVVTDEYVRDLFAYLRHADIHEDPVKKQEAFQAAGKLIGAKLDALPMVPVYRPPLWLLVLGLLLPIGTWFADPGAFVYALGVAAAALALLVPWCFQWWVSDAWVFNKDGKDCARTPAGMYEKVWAVVPDLMRQYVTPDQMTSRKWADVPDPRPRVWWALGEEAAALVAALLWRHLLGFDSNYGAYAVLLPIAAYEMGRSRAVTEQLVWKSACWLVLLTLVPFYASAPVHVLLNWASEKTSCSLGRGAEYDDAFLSAQKEPMRQLVKRTRRRRSAGLRGETFPLGRHSVQPASCITAGVTNTKPKELNPKARVVVHASTNIDHMLPVISSVTHGVSLPDDTYAGPLKRYTAKAQGAGPSRAFVESVEECMADVTAAAAYYPHVSREDHINRRNENNEYQVSGPKRRAYLDAVKKFRRWGYSPLKALTCMIKVEPMVVGAGPASMRAIVFGSPEQPAWWGSGVARVMRVAKRYFGCTHPYVHLVCGMRSSVVACLIGDAVAGGTGFGADARGADNEFCAGLQKLVMKFYRAAGATNELIQAMMRHTKVAVHAADGSFTVTGVSSVLQSGRPDTSLAQSVRFCLACAYVARLMWDKYGVTLRVFVCSDDIFVVVCGLQGEEASLAMALFVTIANLETSSEFEVTADGTFLAGVPISAGEAVRVRKPTAFGWQVVESRWKLLQHPGRILPKLGVASYTAPGKREASWAVSSLMAAAKEYRGIPLVDSALRSWARELGVVVHTEVYPEYAALLGARHRLPTREAEKAYSVAPRGVVVDFAGLEPILEEAGANPVVAEGPRVQIWEEDYVEDFAPAPALRVSKYRPPVPELLGPEHVDARHRPAVETTAERFLRTSLILH